MMLLLLFVAAYGAMLYALQERKVPVIVMRLWFTAHLLLALVLSHVACRVIRFLGDTCKLFSNDMSEGLSRVCKAIVFRCVVRPTMRHVRVVRTEGSLPYALDRTAGVMNHTSFWDPLSFLCYVPLRYNWESKTFLKSSLRNLPIFGYVLRSSGHFPVYFADESSAAFTTNRDKQAAVTAEAEQFLSKPNRYIAFFPEGVLNRDTAHLKDFRLGSFNTILKHKMPITYVVVVGHNELWHPDLKGIPGFPTDIYYYSGKYEYDPATTDAKALADGLREEMQSRLTWIIEQRDKTGYKPWYVPPPPKEKKAQ